jgi:hypothetical protein
MDIKRGTLQGYRKSGRRGALDRNTRPDAIRERKTGYGFALDVTNRKHIERALERRAQASVVLAQKTYDRSSQTSTPGNASASEHGNAPQARLDQATDALHERQRAMDQAKSAYEQAVNGYTMEERQIAEANVQKAIGPFQTRSDHALTSLSRRAFSMARTACFLASMFVSERCELRAASRQSFTASLRVVATRSAFAVSRSVSALTSAIQHPSTIWA